MGKDNWNGEEMGTLNGTSGLLREDKTHRKLLHIA